MLLDDVIYLLKSICQEKLFCNILKVFWEKDNCFEEGIQQDKDRVKLEIFEWIIKRLLEFGIRMIWRIMQIEEGVIHWDLIQ